MEYQIKRSKRKTLAIRISTEGEVIVCAPWWVSKRRISTLVEENDRKIEKMLNQFRTLPKPRKITLQERNQLHEQEAILRNRIREISEQTNLQYTSVRIGNAQKQFGSCSAGGCITLTVYLVELEDSLRDYVILHELCHTVHHNHSKQFYQLVEKWMPDWKRRQEQLKQIVLPTLIK